MTRSAIYQIRNQLNGKCYVGSAVNLRKRWRAHLSELRRKTHHNPHLQAAFERYGESAFAFEVLEEVTSENLIAREQHYLDTLRPEYNIAPTAGSRLGCHHSLQVRKKMSGAGNPMWGKHPSEATRRKLSEAKKGKRGPNYGKRFSPEYRAKIAKAQMGKHHSAERCKRISEGLKAYYRRLRGGDEAYGTSAS